MKSLAHGKELLIAYCAVARKAFMCIVSCRTLVCVFCFLFLNACTLPRIVVLDDPLSPEEHLNLGVSYEQSGEPDNALKEYEKASKKIPLAFLYMGNVYYSKKDFSKAEKYYRKALKKDPLNADAHNNLAWLYYERAKNLREAEQMALKAMELNPAKKDIYEDTLSKIREALRTNEE